MRPRKRQRRRKALQRLQEDPHAVDLRTIPSAVGGDVVDLRDGIIYVNGKALDDPWATGETRAETGAVIYPYQVRPGNVFVLGDNREASMDSRAFGEVNLRQIKGKILFRIGPGARQSETEE